MAMEWPDYPWAELSADAVLDGWRERIARVASEESHHFALLPYVRGVAVIGGVGRGSHWPCSDIDMLIAADAWRGRDPEDLVRAEEHKRNDRLYQQGIPNDIEASGWVVLARDLSEAVTESDDAFFARLEHPHWLGIVIKSAGARATHDFGGCVHAFLDRCNETFYTDRFAQLWLHKVITYCTEQLGIAERHIRDGRHMQGSLDILRTTYQRLPAGAYAIWRKIPQSSARSVTRFLRVAGEAGDSTVAALYLAASRLAEQTVWERFAAVPLRGRQMRDLMWTIRRGAGEELDELSVTRDVLNLSLWTTVITDSSDGPRPAWTGATPDPGKVLRQFEAARTLLDWLHKEADTPTSASRRRGQTGLTHHVKGTGRSGDADGSAENQ
ncbi:MAG TPA: hypothetical protein VMZ31_13525 [Phycisphaerae bacterium]|nr:hypothetical protein [Phycisphaerae bacterium]